MWFVGLVFLNNFFFLFFLLFEHVSLYVFMLSCVSDGSSDGEVFASIQLEPEYFVFESTCLTLSAAALTEHFV